MSTNKRRNLNSGQWACIAADADDLLAAIAEQVEKDKAKKNAEAAKAQHAGSDKKLSNPPVSHHETATAYKAATLFNTNRTYVNQAVKMKDKAPEVFEKVKAGKMTMQDANKAVRAIPTDPWLDDEKERKAMSTK